MRNPIKLKHDAEALDGKDIEFRVFSVGGNPPQEGIATGNGTLHLAGPDDEGMFEAHMEITVLPDNPARVGTWLITELPLSQRSADCIEILTM